MINKVMEEISKIDTEFKKMVNSIFQRNRHL